jgi:EAL domain-containing protein (putative c-di-GMP-specific phosphodiesterase class I)
MFHSTLSSGAAAHRAKRAFPAFQIMLQPIIDLELKTVYGYEALCRGRAGENYSTLIAGMEPGVIAAFDKLAMARSLHLAAKFRLEAKGAKIAINLGPLMDALGNDSSCVMRLAKHYGISTSSVVLELSEGVKMDAARLARIVDIHQEAGVAIAIDDFGAGYSGLNMLAMCKPDMVKIDLELTRGIDTSFAKQTIVRAFSRVCRQLGVILIAEGVETYEEYEILRGFKIRFMQGRLFGAPSAHEDSEVIFPREALKFFPAITNADKKWLRNAIRC